MKVIVGESVYETNRKVLKGILKVAKEQVPFGIYAVEKDEICELRKDKFDSMELEVRDIEDIALLMNRETFDRFCGLWRKYHEE